MAKVIILPCWTHGYVGVAVDLDRLKAAVEAARQIASVSRAMSVCFPVDGFRPGCDTFEFSRVLIWADRIELSAPTEGYLGAADVVIQDWDSILGSEEPSFLWLDDETSSKAKEDAAEAATWIDV